MLRLFYAVSIIIVFICTLLYSDDVVPESKNRDKVIDSFLNLGLIHDRGLALTGFHKSTNKWIGGKFLFIDNDILPLSKEIRSSLMNETLGNLKRSDRLLENEVCNSDDPGVDSKVTLLAYEILNDSELSTMRSLLLHREGFLALNRKLFVDQYEITERQLSSINNISKRKFKKESLPLHRAIFLSDECQIINCMLALRIVSKSCDYEILKLLSKKQVTILKSDLKSSIKLTSKIGFNESYLVWRESGVPHE